MNDNNGYKTCDHCCYDILDDEGDVMDHECVSDNQLIAEFYLENIPHEHTFGIALLHMESEAMEFHTSWDWLMPVVEKIENGGLDPHELIDKALESRLIEDVYNEVVDTIKRYNNEEKEKIQDRVCRV